MYDYSDYKKLIDSVNTIALLPHVNADGDATGSCFALAAALRKLCKTVDVIFEEFPRMSEVVSGEYKVYKGDDCSYDAVFAIDCADLPRLGKRANIFEGKTVCLDHHKTNGKIAMLNHVEPDSSATGEIIFELIKFIDPGLFDTYIAECLHMAIAADSGCFQYSNTSPRTHRIAAELLEIGGDFVRINRANIVV